MRQTFKLQSLSYKPLNSQLSAYQILRFSSITKSSKPSPHSKKTQEHQLEDHAEIKTSNSLFKEISDIVGADVLIPDKTPYGFFISRETHVGDNEITGEFKFCEKGVCENAELNNGLPKEGSVLAFGDIKVEALNETDVSAVVQEITGIVRAENCKALMEERLDNVGFQLDPEVVEKVLKRCYKVPHLAYRFFNWVKTKDGFCHTTKTYNTMLYTAGEAREFSMVDLLLEEMEKYSCEKDIKTWTILIQQYGKAELIGKALLVLEKMRKSGYEPDLEVYEVMLHSLCNAGKGEIALEFYKEMVQREIEPNLSLYKMLLNCLAKSGDVSAVQSVADDMIRVSQIPEHDVHVCVLKSYCVAGRIREALELIRDLKNKETQLDYEFSETLVKGLCRANRIADALEIVEIMKRKDFVDGKVYGIIINGYLRRKELSKALDLFQSMKEFGHLPATSTYTELMQHLFRSNEYQKGRELYDEMLERGVEIDSVAFMAIVAGHVRQDHISEAWEVFETMEDKGIKPTEKSYSIFIKELCKVLRTDEIIKVLDKMQASKMFIRDEIFEGVISCMEKKGEMDNIRKAKQMYRICRLHSLNDEISRNDLSREEELHVDSNCNEPVQGRMDWNSVKPLSKAYDEQDLREILRILSSLEDWPIIQDALEKCTIQFTPELVAETLRNCSMHGNAALHFFAWVGKQNGFCQTTETYNMAMKISGRGKDFKHMRGLFYEMRRKGFLIPPDTWAIMIMQYGRTGLTEIALKIFGEMKASGCNPNDSTYKYLIICLCGRKGRKVDEAVKIFQEMIRAGHVPDKELVEAYLCCLCEVGKLLEARKAIDSLCKAGFTVPASYSLYIRALCRAGMLEEALSLVDQVSTEKTTLDRYTHGSLVHGLLQKGRLEEALAKVDSMKQVGINPTVHVYTSLIVHFFKEKQASKALEIFETMKQEGCEPTIVTYSALIRGYMDTENVIEAWNVFHSLKEKGPAPDFKTYSMFISCLCRAGKSEEAAQLLSDMMDNGIVPSNVNFRTVFFGLNREGKQSLAQTVLQKKWALTSKRKFS
ncbi:PENTATRICOPEPTIDE REPEAT-CONTAINING PROTEIN [Salix viminalis]|uniref:PENTATRICOPEPTIDE REPEAT-CONTAINING PROTEIN n=1 Tax=Salix viminalis TaxID=40686 RepID=A0A9Q0V6Q3_SALVM|nr:PENTATRICOPEPTIDE REPEAT-CONTAINING PROTEIN [Salix viminalis]